MGVAWSYSPGKRIAPPPRSTVLRLVVHAKPTWGPMLWKSQLLAYLLTPFNPEKVIIPGVPETGLIAVVSKEFCLLCSSTRGASRSYRNPMLRVRFGLTRQSSCTNNPQEYIVVSNVSACCKVAEFTLPSKRFARLPRAAFVLITVLVKANEPPAVGK